VADILLKEIILQYGPPSVIMSDQGQQFMADLVEELCNLFTIRKLTSTGYRPQTMGLVERFNHTLIKMLKHYANTRADDWDVYVPYVLFAYRTTYNPVIRDTPFFLLYGYEPLLPYDLYLLPDELVYTTAEETRNRVAARMNEARGLARRNLQAAQQKMKERYDKEAQERKFSINELVMDVRPHGLSSKFSKTYRGPYRVLARMGRNYHLKDPRTGHLVIRHEDNLKRYFASTIRPELQVLLDPEQDAPAQPAPALVDRHANLVDHTIRQALKIIPMARLRAILHAAMDETRQQQQQTPTTAAPTDLVPHGVQPLDELIARVQAAPPQPMAEDDLPPPVPTYQPDNRANTNDLVAEDQGADEAQVDGAMDEEVVIQEPSPDERCEEDENQGHPSHGRQHLRVSFRNDAYQDRHNRRKKRRLNPPQQQHYQHHPVRHRQPSLLRRDTQFTVTLPATTRSGRRVRSTSPTVRLRP
jgi:HPt (histidine-containing phosphotransfer) domain-containing protein